jgi:hypothetical protein
MSDGDKPNATIAPANRITQRPQLLGLDFISDHDKLDVGLRLNAVDQFR